MAPTKRSLSPRIIALLAGVAVVAIGIDQVTKALALAFLPYATEVPVVGQALVFFLIRNPGAAFSFGVSMTWVFSILAVIVAGIIIWLSPRIKSVGWAIMLGLLFGGAVGNLIDRLFREPGFGRGEVIDFISTPWLMPAIYNVADMCITSSMVVFVLLILRGIKLDGTREKKDAAAELKTEQNAQQKAQQKTAEGS